MSNRVVVKIGTKVINNDKGVLDKQRIANIVEQVIALKKQGYDIALVSSGAMGAGKMLLNTSERLKGVSEKQLYSAIGQAHLIEQYAKLFRKAHLLCAQVLATKEDFRDSVHFFNMRNCLEVLLNDKVIPIINENDVVAVGELTFTDNDELAGLVASMLNADKLIILSTVDGLLDNTDTIPSVVNVIEYEDQDKFKLLVSPDKSEAGRGGMTTKFEIAKRLANQGIEVIIANGTTKNTIVDAIEGVDNVGTRFIAGKRLTNAKRRIAHSDGLVRGKAFVNHGAVERIIQKEGANSLLLVGVTEIEGSFEKGSLIEIFNENAIKIGYGMSQYESNEAQQNIGKKNLKPLIHYDYMFIE